MMMVRIPLMLTMILVIILMMLTIEAPWWRWWLMLAPMQIYSLVCLAYFSKWNISISPNWILLFLQIDRTFLIKMIYDGISQCCHFLQCIINDEWGSFFNEKMGHTSIPLQIKNPQNFKNTNGNYSKKENNLFCNFAQARNWSHLIAEAF